MDRIKQLIRQHWIALLLAFIIGVLVVSPTLVSIRKLTPNTFKGIYPMFNDDEDVYLTMTREAYDGHTNLSNAYIKDYKAGPYLQPPLPEVVYSGIAKVLHVSVATEAVVNDFFTPLISFLILYSLIWMQTKSKKISLALSSLFFLFFLGSFGRPINPQFGFIFLLLGFQCIWIIATNTFPKKKIILWNLALAGCFGVLVYAYPFYWMTLGVVYTVWTLSIALKEKEWRYWLTNWLWFFIPAGICTLPFLYNAKLLASSPFFIEANERFGFLATHFPGSYFQIILIILCFPLAFAVWKLNQKYLSNIVLFAPALILSGIILNWQNIITGKTLQFPPHFYPVMVLFIFLIASVTIHTVCREGVRRLWSIICVTTLVLLCIIIGNRQKGEAIAVIRNIYKPVDITKLQDIGRVTQWLSQNTPPDSAVYALGENYFWAIPIYTSDNLYFAPNASLTMMSDLELENRWAIQHFFDDETESRVTQASREIWANKFIDSYQNKEVRRKILELITRKQYPENILMDESYPKRVFQIYKKNKEMGFEKALKTYSVDYILLDNSDKRYTSLEEKFNSFSFIKEVARFGDTIIYKIK